MRNWLHGVLILLSALLQMPVRPAPVENHRVVTRITVVEDGNSATAQTYSDTDEMEAILTYLRLLEPGARALIAPETFRTPACDFVLTYSDGTQSTYSRLHDEYLKKDDGIWRRISAKDGLLFQEPWRIMTAQIQNSGGACREGLETFQNHNPP